MLIDYDVLEKFGTSKASIKALFTAKDGDPLFDKRKEWEERIRGRIQEGAMWGIKNYQFFAAADLAWDSNTITKELVPLMLFAQGKVTFANIKDDLRNLTEETREAIVRKDKDNNPIGIDIPAFHKVVVNLVRSLITKRVASLSVRYVKQDPLYKYLPYGTSYVARLRGDALSQRVEMIVNQYDYRHDLTQCVRDMLLYSHIVEFPVSAWDRERSIRKKRTPGATDETFQMQSYIAREGLLYKRPHPSRVFYDMAHALSSLNTDTGCEYVGHWNVLPFRKVKNNRAFYNIDRVEYDSSFASRLVGYRNYWSLYFAGQAINFPGVDGQADVMGANEREKQSGVYTSEDGDSMIMLTEYFERVIPRDVGLGKYPFPVWVRLVVAADDTVVYGEIMPCTPATVWMYNCADGKILNNGFSHECFPWQDQMSNMLTNLLFAQRAALIKLLALDIDMIGDAEIVKEIRSIMKGEQIYTRPLLIEYKGVQAQEMGMDPRRVLTLSETQALSDPTVYVRALMQVLSLAERILGTSANESSQSEPREVSATESSNIASAVNTNIAFMAQGVDEGVAAKKRQLYEAFMACGDTRVVVPVANRYTEATIKAAGFEPYSEEEEGAGLSENYAGDQPQRLTIMGEKSALEFGYMFGARDGSERPIDPKAAEVLVQLLQPLAQMPGVLQAMGKETLYKFLNAIIRMSGAGIDVQFELKDGEGDGVATGDPVADSKNAVEQAISQILQAVEQNRMSIAQLQQAVGQRVQAMPSGIPQPAQPIQ